MRAVHYKNCTLSSSAAQVAGHPRQWPGALGRWRIAKAPRCNYGCASRPWWRPGGWQQQGRLSRWSPRLWRQPSRWWRRTWRWGRPKGRRCAAAPCAAAPLGSVGGSSRRVACDACVRRIVGRHKCVRLRVGVKAPSLGDAQESASGHPIDCAAWDLAQVALQRGRVAHRGDHPDDRI